MSLNLPLQNLSPSINVMTLSVILLVTLMLLISPHNIDSYKIVPTTKINTSPTTSPLTRRDWGVNIGLNIRRIALSTILTSSIVAIKPDYSIAAGGGPTEEDLARLKKGAGEVR